MSVVKNGTLLQIYSGSGEVSSSANWQQIATAVSYTLSITQSPRDTSSKSSGKFETVANGRLSIEGSCDGLMSDDAGMGYQELMNLVYTRATVKLLFADQLSEDDTNADISGSNASYITGSFIFTDFTQTAGSEENGTYSANFKLNQGDFLLGNLR